MISRDKIRFFDKDLKEFKKLYIEAEEKGHL